MFKKGIFAIIVIVVTFFTVLETGKNKIKIGNSWRSELPSPTQKVNLSKDYDSVRLVGIELDKEDPLLFTFIVDKGEEKYSNDEFAQAVDELIEYFWTALTIPQDSLWVNLSPYESNRVMDDKLSLTALGRDMLAQDYMLKQFSASLTDPESQTGKEYWKAISDQNDNSSFNKIWIMPDQTTVHYDGLRAVLGDNTLLAMTENDYHAANEENLTPQNKSTSSQMLLPIINREINSGYNFSKLRRMYDAIVLAGWFKNVFIESCYKNFIDSKTVDGIELEEKNIKNKIFSLYVEAYQKGVYDTIRKEYAQNGTQIKRRYSSGGLIFSSAVNYELMDFRDAIAKINPDFTDLYSVKAKVESNKQLLLSIAPNYSRNFGLFDKFGQEKIQNATTMFNWVVSRLETRFHIELDSDVDFRKQLFDEFVKGTFFNENYLSKLQQSFVNKEEYRIRKFIFSELQLFYTSIPLVKNEGKVSFFKTNQRGSVAGIRKEYRQRLEQQVSENADYWKRLTDRYAADIVDNGLEISEIDVSVNIIMLTDRLDMVLKRIQEIETDGSNLKKEIVLALADPENLTSEARSKLDTMLQRSKLPIKLIYSKVNSIAINRNICTAYSSGGYRIMLDDDVALVGPVIPNLVRALKNNEFMGAVSIPSYTEKDMLVEKPQVYSLKKFLDNDIVLTNVVPGNIIAVRDEIAKAVPFITFWPNYGEDARFSQSINQVGFINGFIYAEDAYVIHQKTETSATNSTGTLANVLLNDALSYSLDSESYDSIAFDSLVFRLSKYGTTNVDIDIIVQFWNDYKDAFVTALGGDFSKLDYLNSNSYTNIFAVQNRHVFGEIIKRLEENIVDIVEFVNKQEKHELIHPFYGVLEPEEVQNINLVENTAMFWNNKISDLKNEEIGGIDFTVQSERIDIPVLSELSEKWFASVFNFSGSRVVRYQIENIVE